MSNKWRVAFGDHVLGHFAAKTPEESVTKAINRSKDYHPEVAGKGNIFFTVKAGSSDNTVYKVSTDYQEVTV